MCRVLLVVLAPALGACQLIADYRTVVAQPPPGDLRVERSGDTSGPVDATPDVGDGAMLRDGPRVEETWLDGGAPPDAPANDVPGGQDANPNLACKSPSTPLQVYPSQSMVICGSAQGLDQCAAEQRCNVGAGWELCTASQYRLRGGKAVTASAEGWIRGCIRDKCAVQTPSDAYCSACAFEATCKLETAQWVCGSPSGSSGASKYIGMVSFSGCNSLGEQTGYEARWRAFSSGLLRFASVCCKRP